MTMLKQPTEEELYALLVEHVMENLTDEERDELLLKCVEESTIRGGTYYLSELEINTQRKQ